MVLAPQDFVSSASQRSISSEDSEVKDFLPDVSSTETVRSGSLLESGGGVISRM